MPAGNFLAITFTRRAAQEVQDRLAGLCPGQPTVTTFHGLGLRILREHHEAAGLGPRFKVADETVTLQVATELTGSERDGRKLIAGLAEDPDGQAGPAPRTDCPRPGGLRRAGRDVSRPAPRRSRHRR